MNRRHYIIVSLVSLILATSFVANGQFGEWLPTIPSEEVESGEHSWYIRGLFYQPIVEHWERPEFSVLVHVKRAFLEQIYLDPSWEYQFFVYLYLAWDYPRWSDNGTVSRFLMNPCFRCYGEADLYTRQITINESSIIHMEYRRLFFYVNVSMTSSNGNEQGWETSGYNHPVSILVYPSWECGGIGQVKYTPCPFPFQFMCPEGTHPTDLWKFIGPFTVSIVGLLFISVIIKHVRQKRREEKEERG